MYSIHYYNETDFSVNGRKIPVEDTNFPRWFWIDPFTILVLLKGQCHEIFDPWFFRQSITPRPLIYTLKYFRFLFRIRRAITEYVFVQRYAA
jgi:hypothetical protein